MGQGYAGILDTRFAIQLDLLPPGILGFPRLVPWIQRAAPLGNGLHLFPESGNESFTALHSGCLNGMESQTCFSRGSNARIPIDVPI